MSSTSDQSLTFWLNNAGRYPVLKQDQVNRLARLMRSHEEGSPKYRSYMNKIVNCNLRLVASLVCTYMNQKSCRRWGSVDSLDYLQAGSLGLMKAVRMYDPDRGYKFSTYAYNWIYSYVGRINIQLSSIMKLSEEACRISYNLQRNKKIVHRSPEMARQITEMVMLAQSTGSLDWRTHDGTPLYDIIADESTLIDRQVLNERIEEIAEYFDEVDITEEEKEVLMKTVVENMRPCAVDRQRGTEIGDTLRIKRDALKKLKKVGPPASISV